MKRLLLIAFICVIAIISVSANEGMAYEAISEPALTQQSLGQYFDVTEITVNLEDPAHTDFSLFSAHSANKETVNYFFGTTDDEHRISLIGSTTIYNPTSQTTFVNFSPGIAAKQSVAENLLC